MKATLFTGKIVMVFDPRLWDANGGDSKTDTFFREAEVLKIYPENVYGWTMRMPRTLVDVRFLHDDRISRGHFGDGIEECPMAVSR